MELGYSKEHRKRMLTSGRKGGFIKGKLSAVAMFVSKFPKNKKILDFGAGYYASNLQKLKKNGFNNIVGYDLPENSSNWSEDFDKDALKKKWDVIMLSNVINVQPNINSAVRLITNLYQFNLEDEGIIIFNIPVSPRYFDVDIDQFKYSILDMTDKNLEEIKVKNTVLYTISK